MQENFSKDSSINGQILKRPQEHHHKLCKEIKEQRYDLGYGIAEPFQTDQRRTVPPQYQGHEQHPRNHQEMSTNRKRLRAI